MNWLNQLAKGGAILLSYIFFEALLTSIIIIFLMIAGVQISVFYPFFIGGMGTLSVVWFTVRMTMVEVGGNKILVTSSMLPFGINKGHIRYRFYTTGFHFIWWWERIEDTIDLEDPIFGSFEHKVSAQDGDILVELQYRGLLDPENISAVMLMGKNNEDRKKNITTAIEIFLKRNVETFLSQKKTSTIVQNMEGIIDGEEGLQKHLSITIDEESKRLGVNIMEVKIGNVDYSKAVSEARDNRLTVEMQIEAVEKTKGRLGELSDKEAIEFVEVQTGNAKKTIIDFQTRKGLKSVVPIGAA